jgi:hypothetical protein
LNHRLEQRTELVQVQVQVQVQGHVEKKVHHHQVLRKTVKVTAAWPMQKWVRRLMHGARFSAEIYTRGCHWIPRMFLKRTYV